MGAKPLTIVVSGMIAADPFQGGASWAVLQYVLGLRQLGHDVYFVEPIPPSGAPKNADDIHAARERYFRDVVSEFELEDHAALLLSDGPPWSTVGMSYEQLVGACDKADLLLNISGMLTVPELTRGVEVRAYLDLDPAFVQLWAEQGIDMRLDGHTHFVTVGLELGSEACPVPLCGRQWITTLQPIVLEEWPAGDDIENDAFTTVGNFRGYGSVELDGQFLGQKVHSLRSCYELPTLVDHRIALAMSVHEDETSDLNSLRENGWILLDPRAVAGTPSQYRNFVRTSMAEFGLAKHGYAQSRCGWFSDRSVCYLACGRPVVAQDTGFSRHLPVGEGLLTFNTTAEAAAAMDDVVTNYEDHRVAARSLAETYFASEVVLPRLLNQLGLGAI